MDSFSEDPVKSTNRISFWTFVIISVVILAGRFITGLGNNIPVYIVSTNIVCFVLGIWFLRKVLLNYFTDSSSTIILVLVVGGTNILCLAAVEPDVLHPILFLCYSLILWSTIEWHKTFTWKYAILLSLITALTISIRLSEISCILIPVFWSIFNKNTFQDRWNSIKQHHWQSIVIVALLILAFLIQLLQPDVLWRALDLTGNSQKNHFTFIGPYLPDVLFSFRKGWLIYTPVMIFSILGFYFLAGKNPGIFYSVFLFFIINLYVVSSWSIWWDGESFGQISLISSYPVMALPLGYFVDVVMQKKQYVKFPLFILLGFLIFLNLFQTWQYSQGILDPSRMTREYWGAVFGAIHPDKGAEKYLLQESSDVYKEKIHNENRYNRRILIHYDFDKPDHAYFSAPVSERSKSGRFSYKLYEKDQFSPAISEKFSKLTNKEYTWVRASGWVYYSTEDAIKNAFLVITCNHGNQLYKYKALALEKENLIPGIWNKVVADWQTPYLMNKDDLLQSYFWYPGKKSILVDDFQVELFEPKE